MGINFWELPIHPSTRKLDDQLSKRKSAIGKKGIGYINKSIILVVIRILLLSLWKHLPMRRLLQRPLLHVSYAIGLEAMIVSAITSYSTYSKLM